MRNLINPIIQNSEFFLFGKNKIVFFLKEIFFLLSGAIKNKDIEYIHKLRVTSRRLRETIKIFQNCFDKSQIKNIRKSVKRLAKTAGFARDLDVQILFLNDFIKNLDKQSEYLKGVKRILFRIEQHRKEAQKEIINEIRDFKNNKFIKNFLKTNESSDYIISDNFLENYSNDIFDVIEDEIKEVLKYEKYVNKEEKINEHHNMRIAIKHLRYSLEIFNEVYNNKLNIYIKKLKNMQDILGGMHDCDVWQDFIYNFLKNEKKLIKEYFGNLNNFYKIQKGAEFLFNNRVNKRKELYNEFKKEWQKLKKENFFENIKNTIISKDT